MPVQHTRFALSALLLLAAGVLSAQQPLDSSITVTAAYSVEQFLQSQAPIELKLSRAPSPAEGRIAVFVGSADLTTLFELSGTRLIFQSRGDDLPAGESELKVFLVTGPTWKEIAKFPIRVLTPKGFETAQFAASTEVRNTGQLAEQVSGGQVASDRPQFQSVGATFGLQTRHKRGRVSLTSETHFLGAGQKSEALRFGEQGDRAAQIDLADYVIRFEAPYTTVALGQVSTGTNRHLINGFGSRGVTATFGTPRASISIGAANGTSIVGTDNILGLNRANHRILSSTLALELLPSRPGALHVEATALQGSVASQSGFTQGGITSADRSDGYGFQVAASTPAQRLRVAAGFANSVSQFAAEPPTSGGSVTATPSHRKSARYLEANVGLLQDRKFFVVVPVTLNLALRHERVDPLYRSVAVSTQSDIQRDGFDLSGNIDAVSLQLSGSRTSDNLSAVASLMTSRSQGTAITLSTPLASLLRANPTRTWIPTFNYARQQMHQFGVGVPTGGGFSASDIPDQQTTIQDAGLNWQIDQWQLGYRVNQSDQDNRQPGFETADASTRTHGVTVGVTPRSNLRVGLEIGVERQDNKKLAQKNYLRRGAINANWNVTPVTTLDGSLTLSSTQDRGADGDTHLSAVQLGIARGINLWRSESPTPRGQVFLRFTKRDNRLISISAPFDPPRQEGGVWNVASGLTLRLF